MPRNEAIQRLQVIVESLQLQATEQIQDHPLVIEEQMDLLHVMHLTMNRVSLTAMWLIENILKDFSYEGAPKFRKEYPRFDAICKELDRMMDADEEEAGKKARAFITNLWHRSNQSNDTEYQRFSYTRDDLIR